MDVRVTLEMALEPACPEAQHLIVFEAEGAQSRGSFRFPFADRAVLRRHLDDLEALLRVDRSVATDKGLCLERERSVQAMGTALFHALFPGDLRTCLETTRVRAKHAGKRVRLRLGVMPPALAALPWEYLYDDSPAYDTWVGWMDDLVLVRCAVLPIPVTPLRIRPPLRILAVSAGASEQPLEVRSEFEAVRSALEPLSRDGLVLLEWLENPDRLQLLRRLEESHRPVHVFHFVGHSGFDPDTGEGYLELSDGAGGEERLDDGDLALVLRDHTVHLVFLNSCDSAVGDDGHALTGLASRLVQRGFPAVLAMQHPIDDGLASVGAEAFYRALAGGKPLELALSFARRQIRLARRGTFAWGTPVLHLRGRDGVLFEIAGEGEGEAVRREPDPPAGRPPGGRGSVPEPGTPNPVGPEYPRPLADLQEHLRICLGVLSRLEMQRDQLGAFCPPYVLLEIDEKRAKVRALERQIVALSGAKGDLSPHREDTGLDDGKGVR